MVEVLALPPHVLMLLSALVRSLRTAFAPLLAAGDALLGLLQRPLSCAVLPWVLYRSPVGCDEKHLQRSYKIAETGQEATRASRARRPLSSPPLPHSGIRACVVAETVDRSPQGAKGERPLT